MHVHLHAGWTAVGGCNWAEQREQRESKTVTEQKIERRRGENRKERAYA